MHYNLKYWIMSAEFKDKLFMFSWSWRSKYFVKKAAYFRIYQNNYFNKNIKNQLFVRVLKKNFSLKNHETLTETLLSCMTESFIIDVWRLLNTFLLYRIVMVQITNRWQHPHGNKCFSFFYEQKTKWSC